MRVDEKIDNFLGEANKTMGKQILAAVKKFKVKPSEHDEEYGVIQWYTDSKTAQAMKKVLDAKFGKKADIYARDMYVPDGDEWEVAIEY